MTDSTPNLPQPAVLPLEGQLDGQPHQHQWLRAQQLAPDVWLWQCPRPAGCGLSWNVRDDDPGNSGPAVRLDLGAATLAMAHQMMHQQGRLFSTLPERAQTAVQELCLAILSPALPMILEQAINQAPGMPAPPAQLLDMLEVARPELDAGTLYLDVNGQDDLLQITCEREQCMVEPDRCATCQLPKAKHEYGLAELHPFAPHGRRYWWNQELPYKCTPAQAAEAMVLQVLDRHRSDAAPAGVDPAETPEPGQADG